MDPRLLDYYNRELQFVREMGAEFARTYPRIAARLGRSPRPRIENDWRKRVNDRDDVPGPDLRPSLEGNAAKLPGNRGGNDVTILDPGFTFLVHRRAQRADGCGGHFHRQRFWPKTSHDRAQNSRCTKPREPAAPAVALTVAWHRAFRGTARR